MYAVATHGILSRDAPELLEESPIEEVGETPCLLCLCVCVCKGIHPCRSL